MSTPAIQVHNLSKRYRIGLREKRADTFPIPSGQVIGQLGQILRAPVDNFRSLRQLSKFGEEDESVFRALKDIHFEVQESEVPGIIGHNGACKTETFMKLRVASKRSDSHVLKSQTNLLSHYGK